ncbi:hypothetical protein [Williamwhitmania taraxaci]|uniref:DUF4136 domain-containing protein n=1 Tax=Williamwhitmania taraxaci TaxID=1640674 RepID=A0A1G6TQ05_9BACT|nr:hypothetical protein [Williamwhitmania taraxaci]SDD30457.1 hypothetical protein SAMN05216323_11282 [Williamwhitmania taraxaci]
MKRVAALMLILTLAIAQGCYLFEEATVEIFPHERIAKYYLSNLVSAPDRDNDVSRKERAKTDLKQFLENWNNNMEEVLFDVAIDSILFKELKVIHKKLSASVVLRYKQLNNLTDTVKPGFYLLKLSADNSVVHNGTEVIIDSTNYAQWPKSTEKIILKFRNITVKNIHRQRMYIRLGKLYQENLEHKH